MTPVSNDVPGASDWANAAREEQLFRRVMRYATDRLWELRVHELGMALLHDVLDDAEGRKAKQAGHESVPQ